ncbi:hypothetical protein PAAG_05373 [Paracoccidioides lutzii Pb01]|uniref:Uncharacterized protein n=1 Tax=Paracoccidioides lutzii (strain ATCC MYA-826 / Pb01) TaxID=502779 RepID=C1H3N0_PARBA|nr:hypothetical protein PAAG_05373 [Paracoccidioides lutzii Pb01]EEH34324.2 hypothetical protein PAAG_05373 [Paracoccidioides lutzii Pb01]
MDSAPDGSTRYSIVGLCKVKALYRLMKFELQLSSTSVPFSRFCSSSHEYPRPSQSMLFLEFMLSFSGSRNRLVRASKEVRKKASQPPTTAATSALLPSPG